MPRITKNSATIEPEMPDMSEDVDVNSDAELAIQAEFAAGSDSVSWKARVYRDRAANNEKMHWLFDCTPDDFPVLERVRDDYGTGNYRVFVYRDNTLYRNFSLSVEAPSKKPQSPIGERYEMPQNSLSAMIERQNALFERLLNNQQPQQIAVQNPIDMMRAVMEAVKTATAIIPVSSPAPSALGPETALKLIMEGFNAGKQVGGGEPAERESGIMDLLRDLVKSPIVEKMLDGAVAAQMQQATATIPRPVIAPPSNIQAQEAPEPVKQEETQMNMLTMQLKMLVAKAKAGADVDLYADLIADNMPEETLFTLLNDTDIITKMNAINSEVESVRPWFERLIVSLKSLTMPEPEGETGEHVRATAPTETHKDTQR